MKYIKGVDHDIQDHIFNQMKDSCNSECRYDDAYGVDSGEVIDIMLLNGYEICQVCGWWQPMYHLREVDMNYTCLDCIE